MIWIKLDKGEQKKTKRGGSFFIKGKKVYFFTEFSIEKNKKNLKKIEKIRNYYFFFLNYML